MTAAAATTTAMLTSSAVPPPIAASAGAGAFPPFLPKQVESIKDPYARKLASRIERLPVSFSENCIMSSCVKPLVKGEPNPVVLLHGFDSSCLEWRYTYPLLEDAGLETWAIDILGWGFSDLEQLPACNVANKRNHLYQLWKSYIKKPMILVGPSLGAAIAIDFAVIHPEAVEKLVLIDASVYAEGTGDMANLPRAIAYAGVGRLHCQYPWWEDASVDFMLSGGYNVTDKINQVEQRALIIWGEDDEIISNKLAVRLHAELPNSILHQIPDCGHLPHVEKPNTVANLITDFVLEDSTKEAEFVSLN
ncbi:alpha/beta hydrolase domain-containing protein VTE7 isoform X2 [Syzygium oleosum]|uniref:alpha/beta hydrolase domain-containing protein VTE7 isoform X2 n=1 Tax=Syzygium oleosum TaxID=219896 RepID=UPI0024BAC4F4|nr:alpha/beta hydrolase domain-containing protein VTE7 isoform X2 [Syzygium oleosum]